MDDKRQIVLVLTKLDYGEETKSKHLKFTEHFSDARNPLDANNDG